MDWLIGIYERSFEIVKKNKWLWVFGMILVSTSGANFSGNFNSVNNFSESFKAGETPFATSPSSQLSVFQTAFTAIFNILKQVPVSAYATLAISIIIVMIVSLIIVLVISSWAQGAAIGAINDAYDNKPVTLRKGSLHGIESFKRIIWLLIVPWILYFIAIIIPFIIASIVMALVWDSEITRLFGMLLFLIFLFIIIFSAFAITASLIWAIRITVIEKKGAYESFKEGWKMVKTHFLKMIALGCANCLLGCCLTGIIGATLGGAIVSGIGLLKVNQKAGALFLAFIGIIVVLLIMLSLLFSGIYTIFNVTTWNVLYRELRGKR